MPKKEQDAIQSAGTLAMLAALTGNAHAMRIAEESFLDAVGVPHAAAQDYLDQTRDDTAQVRCIRVTSYGTRKIHYITGTTMAQAWAEENARLYPADAYVVDGKVVHQGVVAANLLIPLLSRNG